VIVAERMQAEAARERIEAGQASAWLTIPAGFSLAVLEERPTELALVTNPAQTILPGIVEETLSMVSEAAFTLHRLIGELAGLRGRTELPLPVRGRAARDGE